MTKDEKRKMRRISCKHAYAPFSSLPPSNPSLALEQVRPYLHLSASILSFTSPVHFLHFASPLLPAAPLDCWYEFASQAISDKRQEQGQSPSRE